jgi:thiopeptide-type bacteriocin biosynthesis protein
MNSNNEWLSTYIYFNEPYYTFLTAKIYPFIKKIVMVNKDVQYFFIFYVDSRGEHVRLRFKLGEKNKEEVKKQIIYAFSKYKIRFVAYKPEVKRYGGYAGVKIAEKLFEASSQVVLSFLADIPNCNYEQALGLAMQLHLAMLSSFGMDKKETKEFFIHHDTKLSLKTLEENSKRQPESLLQKLSYVWTACQNGVTFDVSWFNTWISNTKIIGDELKVAYNKKELKIAKNPLHKNKLWSLYESYIHMTNNRLRISHIDELQINYNLKKSFEIKQL